MEALHQSLHYLHHYEWNFPHFLTALTSKRGKFQQPNFGAVGQATTSKLSNDWRGGLNKQTYPIGKNPFQRVLPQRPKGKFTITNYSSGGSPCKNIISTSRHTICPGNSNTDLSSSMIRPETRTLNTNQAHFRETSFPLFLKLFGNSDFTSKYWQLTDIIWRDKHDVTKSDLTIFLWLSPLHPEGQSSEKLEA